MLTNSKSVALTQGAAAFDCTESATDQQKGGATSYADQLKMFAWDNDV